ncbi:hypothetical protein GW15_0201830 [Xanthomonas axonopodis pv. vasculorum]|uniref:Uncharacterized protein n=1 Tax=Xanthomonas axonopodis pv. vasculorum TaxID=325777 RepID=A0A098Q2B4_9XANT|nr:hypothetical protein GW15_0201830 [Xanthomonas axonopodis pv. vasculorum]
MWALLPCHFLLLQLFSLLGCNEIASQLFKRLHLRGLCDLCGSARNRGFVIGKQCGGQLVELTVASGECLRVFPREGLNNPSNL